LSEAGLTIVAIIVQQYVQRLVDEALENIDDGVKVGGHLVNAVRFADNQAMVANGKGGLQ